MIDLKTALARKRRGQAAPALSEKPSSSEPDIEVINRELGGGAPPNRNGEHDQVGRLAAVEPVTQRPVVPMKRTYAAASVDIPQSLPHSVEAEEAILGAVIQHPIEAIAYLRDKLTLEMFYIPANRTVCGHAFDLFHDSGFLDYTTLIEYLRKVGCLDAVGGPSFITKLFIGNYIASALPHYLPIVEERYLLRQAIAAGTDVVRRAYDGEFDDAAALIETFKTKINSLNISTSAPRSALTVRTLSDLLGMTFDDYDNYFGDRVIAAGQPCTLLGPGGVGKSRLSMQLAVCMILGRDFLDMPTWAPDRRWLFLQSENSNRRLQHDLKKITASLLLTDEELKRVDQHLFIHTIENDADVFINVVDPQNRAKIEVLIRDINPAFVTWDPLNALTDADLNSDQDMRAVVSAITRVTRAGDPDRVPFVLHHSLTGKAGAARAVGWDKASYGRNSKVLQAWTRAQINLAPRSADDANLLIMSCGKNNNGKPFPELGIIFDEAVGIYRKDEDFNPDEFREEVGIALVKKKPIAPQQVAALVEDGIPRTKLITGLRAAHDVSNATAYRAIDKAAAAGAIRKEKGKNFNPIYYRPDAKSDPNERDND